MKKLEEVKNVKKVKKLKDSKIKLYCTVKKAKKGKTVKMRQGHYWSVMYVTVVIRAVLDPLMTLL